MKENDPDTLQYLDESDEKWVKLWGIAASKRTIRNKATFMISPLDEAAIVRKLFAKELSTLKDFLT
jgi:hypothetical protein